MQISKIEKIDLKPYMIKKHQKYCKELYSFAVLKFESLRKNSKKININNKQFNKKLKKMIQKLDIQLVQEYNKNDLRSINFEGVNKVYFLKSKNYNKMASFLNHIRNSLCHNRFTFKNINKNLYIEVEDGAGSKKTKRNMYGIIEINKLQQLIKFLIKEME